MKLDDLFKRSILMVREEKGVWYQIYRVLLQFREEATSRLFKFFRGSQANRVSLFSSLNSLLDDKAEETERVFKDQIRLVAEQESDFWKKSLNITMKNYPRKLSSVNDAPLFSGSTSWLNRIFTPVKNRMKKMIQYSISQNHSIDQSLDRVFGKDTDKEVKVKAWRGTEFQGGVLAKVRKSLQSLVTTSYYEMVYKVRKFAYARTEKISTLRSVAVLDSRTTAVCKEYDGLKFDRKTLKPIGHNRKYVATPRHWNCRSQHIPEDFEGKEFKKVQFEDWFKDLSDSAQNSLLGSRGGDLYRNQQVPLLGLLKRLSPKFMG